MIKTLLPLQEFLTKSHFHSRVTFVSTYIPRKCGIATFTEDLTKHMNELNPQHLCRIIAIANSKKEPVTYPWEVMMQIEKHREEDYALAAKLMNSTSDYACLQHEYGIFGGPDGAYVLQLVKKLTIPLITTFHTVLAKPTPSQKTILQDIAKKSAACVVMIEEAAKRLESIYRIPRKKIVIIPHGVPNIPFSLPSSHKESLGFSQKDFLFGSINLLSENKGIEYVIKALPKIVKAIPHAKFLMIGQTHPMIKLQAGEKYRESLLLLAKQLGVSRHVVEVDRYIALPQLVSYLQGLDIYVTPYLDMSQTASGTLAYAIGAGKCCIATPYIFAKEVMRYHRGLLIPAKDPSALADAVIRVYKDPSLQEKLEKNAYRYGRTMIWSKVALDYLNLLTFVQRKSIVALARKIKQKIIG